MKIPMIIPTIKRVFPEPRRGDDDNSSNEDHNDSKDEHSARDACKDALDDRKKQR